VFFPLKPCFRLVCGEAAKHGKNWCLVALAGVNDTHYFSFKQDKTQSRPQPAFVFSAEEVVARRLSGATGIPAKPQAQSATLASPEGQVRRLRRSTRRV